MQIAIYVSTQCIIALSRGPANYVYRLILSLTASVFVRNLCGIVG